MMSSDEDPAPDVEPFPCLYDEVMEMSLSAASVFGIADLRRLTRSGDFEDQTILQLPASGGDIKAFFQAHKELLKEKIKTRDYNALSILFDDGPGQRDDRSPSSSSSSSFQDVVNCATLHHLGDENASHECVYAVSSNSMRKRIVVSFRGSITVQDWIQDSKFIMADVTNSFRGVDPESPETVQIHYGFKQYLYDDAPSILPSSVHSIVPTANKSGSSLNSNAKGIQHGEREVSNISTKQSKIEEILEKVQTLLDEHPGYKVYVAGHSLGGALSLVFAMEAASKLVTKQAVTCIVLGNPRTGNLAFRQVIHSLEEKGRLRCLCIHNQSDLVPQLPEVVTTGCYLCVCRRHRTFRHVGLKLKISSHGFATSYPNRVNDSWYGDVLRQGKNVLRLVSSLPWAWQCITSKGFSKRHDYAEYLDHLQVHETELRKLYLDDLYRKHRHCG